MLLPQRLNLALQYYNIRMLINRPLMDDRHPDEFPESGFNNRSAAICVRSARKIIHLIVDESNTSDSPWWWLLHYIMPAKAIIMLEMGHQAIHTPEHKAALFADGKMVLDWLKKVSKVNMSVRRYSVELADQLKKVDPRIGEYFEEDESTNAGIPSLVGLPELPFQFSSDAGGEILPPEMPEKSLDVGREQYFDTSSSAPAWWPSTQGESDQIMTDIEQADLYAYSNYLEG